MWSGQTENREFKSVKIPLARGKATESSSRRPCEKSGNRVSFAHFQINAQDRVRIISMRSYFPVFAMTLSVTSVGTLCMV
jgi:hypothetical protein